MSKESAYFTLDELSGKHDVAEIKKWLDALPGVSSVSVSGSRVAVDFDTTAVQQDRIKKQLQNMGYEILSSSSDSYS